MSVTQDLPGGRMGEGGEDWQECCVDLPGVEEGRAAGLSSAQGLPSPHQGWAPCLAQGVKQQY